MKSVLSLGLAILAVAALACSYDSDYNRSDTCNHKDFKSYCDEDLLVTCNSKDQLEETMCAGGCNETSLVCNYGVSCDDIDEKGVCENNVAKKCVSGKLQAQVCTGNSNCGKRSDGQVDCLGRTNVDVPSYTVGQKCPDEITYDGICDGNKVVYCKKGIVQEQLCDTKCMVKNSYTIPFAECFYECGQTTFEGECMDDGYDFCSETEGLIHITCGQGETCGLKEGVYACL